MAHVIGPNLPGESGWREFFIRAADYMPPPVVPQQRPQPVPRPQQPSHVPMTRTVERPGDRPAATYGEYLRTNSTMPGVLTLVAASMMYAADAAAPGLVLLIAGSVVGLWRCVDNPRTYRWTDLLVVLIAYAMAAAQPAVLGAVLSLTLVVGWSVYHYANPRPVTVEETVMVPAPVTPAVTPPVTPTVTAPSRVEAYNQARARQFEALRAQVRTNGYRGASAFLGDHVPHDVTRLGVGAAAEERVGRALEALGDDFAVAHDLSVVKDGRTRANIDHLVAGPPGVILVDAKSWAGGTALRGGELTDCDMRDRAATDPTFARQATMRARVRNKAVETLRWISTTLPRGYPVTVVIVVDGWVDGGAVVVPGTPNVHIVELARAGAYIASLPAARKQPDLAQYIATSRTLRFESPDDDAGWSAR